LRKEIPGYEGKNYPILIAVISIIGCITVAFPCAFNPFRQQFFFTIFGKEDFSKKENFILTFIFTSITLLIAFVFPTVTDIISILGGLCATSLSFAIPLYCYIKLSKDGLKNPKNICALLFFGVLILAGYASVILTVFRIVTKCDSYKDYHDNYPNCKNA
jgi:amino acid permease